MARQIDPWLGGPQTAALEENLLAVQTRLQRLDVRLSEMEARLGRVARVATEAKAAADEVRGQTQQLEEQLSGVAAALLMLADQLGAPGPAQAAAVARKAMELLTESSA
jgi:chromosome segregation ATPase